MKRKIKYNKWCLISFVQGRFNIYVQVFVKIFLFERRLPTTKYYEMYVMAFISLFVGMDWKENKQPEY